MASGVGTVVLYAISGVGGAVLAAGVDQWNKRRDRSHKDGSATVTARVADTEAALRAWDKINNFQADQIKALTVRVGELEDRVEVYEDNVVPKMQGVIDGLRITVNDQQQTIEQQQQTISALLSRIDTLQSGGAG